MVTLSGPLVRGIAKGALLVSLCGLDFTYANDRNKAELQRKARERMARRRAGLKKSDEAWAAYTAKAREDAARYRAQHAEQLAENQRVYRGRCVTVGKY